MRIWLIFLWFALAGLVVAKEPVAGPNEVVDCGASKAVIFPGTKSPDGRYAIGWTIRVIDRKFPPVDWAKLTLTEEGISSLPDLYNLKDPDTPDAPYERDDCVIDLEQKTMKILPSDWAYFPHKNHGHFQVAWSALDQGHRYALVQNDVRFFTMNLWLLDIVEGKISQADLVPALAREVGRWLGEKKPRDFDRYGIFFDLEGGGEGDPDHETQRPAVSFQEGRVLIPFLADIPQVDG